MTTPDPRRLVFVGGLHRSGTTPFSRVLDQHPEISGLVRTGVREDEGQHLQKVYAKAKTYGGSGRFAHAPAAHLTEASPLVTSDNARGILESWVPYWDLEAPLLLEKSPPNIIMGRFLQSLYPGSALIVVVRHPVAVALSNKKWRRLASTDPRKFQSLTQMVAHWLAAHEVLAGDSSRLERLLVIHYERLVRDPLAELARVQDFLGLGAAIDPSGLSTQHGEAYADRWQSYTALWRPGGWQRRLISSRYAHAMARYGYPVDDLARFSPPAGVLGLRDDV